MSPTLAIIITVAGGLIILIVWSFIGWPFKTLANKLWEWVWPARQRKKQEKINNINRAWKNDRKILSSLKHPLLEFNQMDRFPDDYPAKKCLELASDIEEKAQKIQWPEFQEIKDKLIEYAGRRSQIDQNTLLHVLLGLFRKQAEPNKYEPLVLRDEIDKALEISSTPPSEREKKEKRLFKK